MNIFKPTLVKVLIIPIHIILYFYLSKGLAFFIQGIYLFIIGFIVLVFLIIDLILTQFIKNHNSIFKIELCIGALYFLVVFLFLKNI